MAPLEGETLGERHRSLNHLIHDAVSKKTPFQEIENLPELSDCDRLYKIDVAGKYQIVPYILQNLKSDDDLYVSRALKRSVWLVRDPQYSDIINPEYLQSELIPLMTSRAVAKLWRHIRLNLKDEKRAELFYKYLDSNDKKSEALKWLPSCSVAFIEDRLQIEWSNIEINLYRKLCERTVKTFEIITKKRQNEYRQTEYYECVMFLLNSHMDIFLKAVEELGDWRRPTFNKHATKLILSKQPERIIEKLESYIKNINLHEFGKHLGPDGTKDMILKLAKMKSIAEWFNYRNMKPLVQSLPKEGKFEFVKSVFVDKSALGGDDDMVEMSDECAMRYGSIECCLKSASRSVNISSMYQWYRMAPFNTAFNDLKKLIRTESSPDERSAMLKILITSAGKNMDNIYTLLQYFREKHINEPTKFRKSFVNTLMNNKNAYAYDERSWKLVEEILHSLELFTDEDYSYELNSSVQGVVSFNVLHDKPIPEIILKKFMESFYTFEELERKLSEKDKDKMFNFLRSALQKKLDSKSVNEKNDLSEIISTLNDILRLLKDWKKDLDEDILKLVRQLIETKQLDQDLSNVYDTEKKWRRSLFEESLDLSQKEAVYLNALKHKPSLILQKRTALDKIIKTDAIDFSRILKKIRVYFPDKVANQWLNMYEEKLNACRTECLGYKAITRGICILMERDKFSNLLQAYVPENYKIQWSEEDAALVNLRKYLAQQMYLVRPTVHVDTVLLFSKGDYLQYALPSLTSVCHRKSREECRKFLPLLLNGPVSLQKHGIRLAFAKLESKELSETFTSMWKATKNASIRAVIFNLTFDLLCREKNEKKILKVWEFLKTFLEQLTKEENRSIYTTIANVEKTPKVVRAEFCMMSYNLLKSLPAKLNCDSLANDLLTVMADVMDTMDEEFVTEILRKYIKEMYVQKKILQESGSSLGSEYDLSNLITKYIINCRSDKIQARRFENILKVITDHSILMWNEVYNNSLPARNSFISLIDSITTATKEIFEDREQKYVNPAEIFRSIERATRDLPKVENYKFLTTLKFDVAYCESYATVSPDLKASGEEMDTEEESEEQAEKRSNFISSLLAPEFSKYCLVILSEDVKQYSPIYSVFGRTLGKFITSHYDDTDMFALHILKALTADADNIPAYFVAMYMYPTYIGEDDRKNAFLEVRKRFLENKNDAVRLHYYTLIYDKDQYIM